MNTPRVRFVILFLTLASVIPVWAERPTLPESTNQSIRPLSRAAVCAEVIWRGNIDASFSNAANWSDGIVPNSCTVVRFDAHSKDAVIDSGFAGKVAGIRLEKGFVATLRLQRELTVQGDISIKSGRLEQGRYRVSARSLTQDGGMFVGGQAPVWIEEGVLVTGGEFNTPGEAMYVATMTINAPGIVRMGKSGKLNLAGDGAPLDGDGLLDTTTNPSNSVEFTGHATSDLTTAGPARAFHRLGGGRDQVEKKIEQSQTQKASALRRLPPRHGFGEVQSPINLTRGENDLASAVIDTVNGFAYFGAGNYYYGQSTSPGTIVKVRLSDFTRVGAITLAAGELDPTSAVIDTGNGLAYFGTYTAPGIVVKIDLATFSRIAAVSFSSGENRLVSAVIDTDNGYAYFGTRTNPGRVVKVNVSPSSFGRVGVANGNSGENYFTSAIIDIKSGLAFFGTNTSPGRVVRFDINPSNTFARLDVITCDTGENNLGSAVIDTANKFAYFGTNTSPGKVVKFNSASGSFARVAAVDAGTGEGLFNSAVIDPTRGLAYFGSRTNPGNIVRIDINPANTFARLGALTTEIGEDSLNCAVIDTSSSTHYAYFGSRTRPGRIVKFNLDTFARVGVLTLPSGEDHLRRAVYDKDNFLAYFVADTSPGIVIKMNLETFTRIGALTLEPGESSLLAAAIEPDKSYLYVGTFTNPAKIVRIDLVTFTRVDALTLDTGEQGPDPAVIDPINRLAYFGTSTSPGRVVKIDLATFTRVGAITLNTGENGLSSAIIDVANGFAYFSGFAPSSDPDTGIITKVNISPSGFARVGALTLNTGENGLCSAVLDTYTHYTYWGAYSTDHGQIVMVDIDPSRSFARIGGIALSGDETAETALIDDVRGYAYFGGANIPGIISKIDLSTFTRIGSITLGGGEDMPLAAIIDPDLGYAYFGTYNNPAQIARVDLGNTTTSVAVTGLPMLGYPITLTATIAPQLSGNETPTGFVSFTDYGVPITNCIAVSVDPSGQAICTRDDFALGGHYVRAEYSGDYGFNRSDGYSSKFSVATPVTLSVTKSGSGAGKVTSSPAGIDCGGVCSANFPQDTYVDLTPAASFGSTFTGWTGACAGTGVCSVLMSEAKSVNANFDVVGTAYYTVSPCRVFDTRDPAGPTGGLPLVAHSTNLFQISSKCSIPSGARAITANVTVVNAALAGELEIIAGDLATTGTSTISVPVSRARANNAVIGLDTTGQIKVIDPLWGTVHLILDVNGYFQ